MWFFSSLFNNLDYILKSFPYLSPENGYGKPTVNIRTVRSRPPDTLREYVLNVRHGIGTTYKSEYIMGGVTMLYQYDNNIEIMSMISNSLNSNSVIHLMIIHHLQIRDSVTGVGDVIKHTTLKVLVSYSQLRKCDVSLMVFS